jgi:hypothetical protein
VLNSRKVLLKIKISNPFLAPFFGAARLWELLSVAMLGLFAPAWGVPSAERGLPQEVAAFAFFGDGSISREEKTKPIF